MIVGDGPECARTLVGVWNYGSVGRATAVSCHVRKVPRAGSRSVPLIQFRMDSYTPPPLVERSLSVGQEGEAEKAPLLDRPGNVQHAHTQERSADQPPASAEVHAPHETRQVLKKHVLNIPMWEPTVGNQGMSVMP